MHLSVYPLISGASYQYVLFAVKYHQQQQHPFLIFVDAISPERCVHAGGIPIANFQMKHLFTMIASHWASYFGQTIFNRFVTRYVFEEAK